MEIEQCYLIGFNFSLFRVETTGDVHAVVRNDAERAHVAPTRFSPVMTSCKTTVKDHKQVIDMDISIDLFRFP